MQKHPTRLVTILVVWSIGIAPWFSMEPVAAQELSRSRTEFHPLWTPESVGESARLPEWLSVNRLLSTPPSQKNSVESMVQLAVGTRPVQQPHADGTWREDGRYVVIKLNGQEFKLVKETSSRSQNGGTQVSGPTIAEQVSLLMKPEVVKTSGMVSGRLLNGRRPLADCRVSLVPLRRSGFGEYRVNGAGEPQSTVTDDDGIYRFENVPRGPYKLFWLPKNQRSWIRRVEYRPDVSVKAGKLSQIKDIRVALRTAN